MGSRFNVKYILGGLLFSILIVGCFYGYTEYIAETETPDGPNFDHSFIDHSSSFEETKYGETAPTYDEGVASHNTELEDISYGFEYSRDYAEGSIYTDTKVDQDNREVLLTNRITQPDRELIRDSYFANETRYMRLRDGSSDSDNWRYQSQESTMEEVTTTGYNEINSLEISGVSFEVSNSIERNDIKYYVYEPQIIDREEFKNNSWRNIDGSPESVSIEGEVVLSEYGIVTSAQVEYTIGDTVITVDYRLTEVGSVDIDEPIWIPEAENNSAE